MEALSIAGFSLEPELGAREKFIDCSTPFTSSNFSANWLSQNERDTENGDRINDSSRDIMRLARIGVKSIKMIPDKVKINRTHCTSKYNPVSPLRIVNSLCIEKNYVIKSLHSTVM